VPADHHEIGCSDSRLLPAFRHRVFMVEVQRRSGGSQSDESVRDMVGDA
jgi:hypothetical protein